MQLPKIPTNRNFQRIPTRNINLPVAEAQVGIAQRNQETKEAIADAQSISSMWGGIATLSRAGVGAFGAIQQRYDEREDKAQVGDYRLKQQQHSIDWDDANRGKKEYAFEEVPAEVRELHGLTDTGDPIPAYTVSADMKRIYQEGFLQEDSAMIKNEDSRLAAVRWAEGEKLTIYAQGKEASYKVQSLYQKTKSVNKITSHIQNEEWPQALATIEVADFGPKVKAEQEHLVMEGKQKSYLNDVVINGSLAQQILTKERLDNNEPDVGSALTEAEDAKFRKQLAGSITSKQNKIAANAAKAAKTSIPLIKEDTESAISLLTAGQEMPVNELMRLEKGLATSDSERATSLRRELQTAVDVQPYISQVMTADPANVEELVFDIVDKLSTSTSKKMEMANYLLTKHNESLDKKAKDPVKFYQGYGIQQDVASPDVTKPADMARYLGEARSLNRTIQGDTGRSGIWMNNRDMGLFNDYMSSVDTKANDQQTMVESITKSLGPDQAQAFFREAGNKGFPGEMVVAADALAQNDPESTKMILEGAKLFNSDYDFKEANRKRIFENKVANRLGNYAITTMDRDSYYDAVHAAYLKLAFTARDTSGTYNATRADKAMEIVFGGPLVTINNRSIRPFRRGQDTGDAKAMLKDVHPITYADVKLKNTNMTHVLGRIDSGDLQLEGIGANQYFLYDSTGYPNGARVKLDNGQDYVFSIPENYTSKKRTIKGKIGGYVGPGEYMTEEAFQNREAGIKAEKAARKLEKAKAKELQRVKAKDSFKNWPFRPAPTDGLM